MGFFWCGGCSSTRSVRLSSDRSMLPAPWRTTRSHDSARASLACVIPSRSKGPPWCWQRRTPKAGLRPASCSSRGSTTAASFSTRTTAAARPGSWRRTLALPCASTGHPSSNRFGWKGLSSECRTRSPTNTSPAGPARARSAPGPHARASPSSLAKPWRPSSRPRCRASPGAPCRAPVFGGATGCCPSGSSSGPAASIACTIVSSTKPRRRVGNEAGFSPEHGKSPDTDGANSRLTPQCRGIRFLHGGGPNRCR